MASRKQDALDERGQRHIRMAGGEAIGIAAHNGDKVALNDLGRSRRSVTTARWTFLVNNAATNPAFWQLLLKRKTATGTRLLK